jgi:abhydrolase domain-containing protein 11
LFFSQVDLPEIERLFPNAQVRHIEGSGHWVHSDNPSSFLDVVHTFLDENEKQKHKF